MSLITPSLFIKPLDLSEVESLIIGLQTNENTDFAVLPNRYRNQLFRDCLITDIRNNLIKHPHDYLYHTIWLMINKENKNIAGHIFFNGSPNGKGKVDMYFEIFETAHKHVYLKECMDGIIIWARTVARIKIIRTIVPLNEETNSNIMVNAGFRKINEHQQYENWIWKK